MGKTKKAETILVTGGAGFIGSHFVSKLLRWGYEVVCVDNFVPTYDPQYKRENIRDHLRSKNYKLYELDICSLPKLDQIFKKRRIDKVVHFAARTGVRASIIDPLIYAQINIAGTYNLLSLSRTHNVKKFILISSSSIYGNGPTPFTEDQSAIKPLSPYAATKRSAELACFSFYKAYGLPITILRLFSVYGPGGRPDMAPYIFTDAILSGKAITRFGDGRTARDWTYIDDIIAGIYQTLDDRVHFATYNLGSNHPISLSDLIKLIEKTCGKKARVHHAPSRAEESQITYANIALAKKNLDWQPQITINEGLKKFIAWFKRERIEKK